MKKLIFLLLMSMSVVGASADDYGYLTFQKSDGSTSSLAVSNLKVTVSGTTLIVKNSSTNQTFTLSDLSKMYFSTSSATGIDDIDAATDDNVVGIYNSIGMFVGQYANVDDAKSKLSHGVYVVKDADKTYKIAVK